MKVLCVCKSGNVRSVTLGRLLKKRGAEVLCCGVDKAFRSSTIIMLLDWADVVFAQKDCLGSLERHIAESVNYRELLRKIDVKFDVGPDDWKVPDHPLLLKVMREMIMSDPEWSLRSGSSD